MKIIVASIEKAIINEFNKNKPFEIVVSIEMIKDNNDKKRPTTEHIRCSLLQIVKISSLFNSESFLKFNN